jgi:hypothetical protein
MQRSSFCMEVFAWVRPAFDSFFTIIFQLTLD